MSEHCELIPESGFCLFQYKLLEQPRNSKDQRNEVKCEIEAFLWAREHKCNGERLGRNWPDDWIQWKEAMCSDFNIK